MFNRLSNYLSTNVMQIMPKILSTHLTPLNTNTANRKEDAPSIHLLYLFSSLPLCVCMCERTELY